MKKLLPFLGFTVLMAACNTTPEVKTDAAQAAQQTIATPDTTGIAEFNAWKAQNELASVNAYKQAQQSQPAPAEKTRTIVKYVPVAKSTQSKPASSTSSNSSSSQQTSSGSSADNGSGSMSN